MERRIEGLKFNGETIYIEVSEVEGKTVEGETGDGFEKTSTEEELIDAGEKVRSTISALAATVQQALTKADPNEWSLEVNIGFEGKAGIPFVTEGGVNGAVKVTANWKREGQDAGNQRT